MTLFGLLSSLFGIRHLLPGNFTQRLEQVVEPVSVLDTKVGLQGLKVGIGNDGAL